MNAAPYIEALLPDRPRILGIDLRPFTVGHLILIDRIKLDGSEAKLALALLICSKRFHEAEEDLFGGRIEKVMDRFHRRLARTWLGLPRHVDWVRGWEEFTAYYQRAFALPRIFKPADTDPRPTGLHEVLVAWTRLGGRYSWKEFLDLPWAVATWECIALTEFESEGKIRVAPDGEEEGTMTPELADKIAAAALATLEGKEAVHE